MVNYIIYQFTNINIKLLSSLLSVHTFLYISIKICTYIIVLGKTYYSRVLLSFSSGSSLALLSREKAFVTSMAVLEVVEVAVLEVAVAVEIIEGLFAEDSTTKLV